jgi:hypothetical protein
MIVVRLTNGNHIRQAADRLTLLDAAPQPEAGSVVLSADGRLIAVGDVLVLAKPMQAAPHRFRVTGLGVDSFRDENGVLFAAKGFRHAPSPANPPGGEDGYSTERAHPIGNETPRPMIDTRDALAEVERQAALVERLSFDLSMLRLLGRGYSRRDLEAELARESKEGR